MGIIIVEKWKNHYKCTKIVAIDAYRMVDVKTLGKKLIIASPTKAGDKYSIELSYLKVLSKCILVIIEKLEKKYLSINKKHEMFKKTKIFTDNSRIFRNISTFGVSFLKPVLSNAFVCIEFY